MPDKPRSPTAERPESLIEALNDSWRLVEFTDAWRGLSAEDQLSRARKWLAAVPADSPRPEERDLPARLLYHLIGDNGECIPQLASDENKDMWRRAVYEAAEFVEAALSDHGSEG